MSPVFRCLKFQKGTTGRERVYKSRRDSDLKAKLCSVTLPDKTTSLDGESIVRERRAERGQERLPEILEARFRADPLGGGEDGSSNDSRAM